MTVRKNIEDYKWSYVEGDAWTSASFWKRYFATDEEYQKFSKAKKAVFYPINDFDKEYLNNHWDSLVTRGQRHPVDIREEKEARERKALARHKQILRSY